MKISQKTDLIAASLLKEACGESKINEIMKFLKKKKLSFVNKRECEITIEVNMIWGGSQTADYLVLFQQKNEKYPNSTTFNETEMREFVESNLREIPFPLQEAEDESHN